MMPRWRAGSLLLGAALGWMLVAVLGAAAVGGLLAFGSAVMRGFFGSTMGAPTETAYALAGTLAMDVTLVAIALHLGRREGSTAGGVQRPWAIAGISAATVVWIAALLGVIAAVPALRDFVEKMPKVLPIDWTAGTPAILTQIGVVVLLAPIAEELFFRGWLWQRARRLGFGAGAAAAFTSFAWLVPHGYPAPARILFLLPAALMFSLARHWGGGVSGSLAPHIVNNAAAVAIGLFSET